jgi:RNA polymerase sigma-70 factor, ECF subfamily
MTAFGEESVTKLLQAGSDGDQSALDKLVPAVYAELHRLAHYYMSHEQRGHVLQTTALINEAYLRLVGTEQRYWRNREHFLAVAAQVMRRILVDFARERLSAKRGGEYAQVSLEENRLARDEKSLDIIALNEALHLLASISERKSRVVELRFFGGLSTQEIAGVLKVSPNTVLSDWRFAKAWLCRQMDRIGADQD